MRSTEKTLSAGGLVSRTGPDLQHLLPPVQLHRLGHQRHDIRLGNSLLAVDGQGGIGVSLTDQALVDEKMAGDLFHRLEDPWIRDAPRTDLGIDHLHSLFQKPVGQGSIPMIVFSAQQAASSPKRSARGIPGGRVASPRAAIRLCRFPLPRR